MICNSVDDRKVMVNDCDPVREPRPHHNHNLSAKAAKMN